MPVPSHHPVVCLLNPSRVHWLLVFCLVLFVQQYKSIPTQMREQGPLWSIATLRVQSTLGRSMAQMMAEDIFRKEGAADDDPYYHKTECKKYFSSSWCCSKPLFLSFFTDLQSDTWPELRNTEWLAFIPWHLFSNLYNWIFGRTLSSQIWFESYCSFLYRPQIQNNNL